MSQPKLQLLLKDIYTDIEIAPSAGFKGGTANQRGLKTRFFENK